MAFLILTFLLGLVASHPHVWDVEQVLDVKTDYIVGYYGPYVNYDTCRFYKNGLYFNLEPQRDDETNYKIEQVILEEIKFRDIRQNNRVEQVNELNKRINDFSNKTVKE